MKYFVIEIELKNPYSFGERLIPYYVIYKCNNSFELNQYLIKYKMENITFTLKGEIVEFLDIRKVMFMLFPLDKLTTTKYNIVKIKTEDNLYDHLQIDNKIIPAQPDDNIEVYSVGTGFDTIDYLGYKNNINYEFLLYNRPVMNIMYLTKKLTDENAFNTFNDVNSNIMTDKYFHKLFVNNLNKQFKKFLKNTTETFDKIITDIK